MEGRRPREQQEQPSARRWTAHRMQPAGSTLLPNGCKGGAGIEPSMRGLQELAPALRRNAAAAVREQPAQGWRAE